MARTLVIKRINVAGRTFEVNKKLRIISKKKCIIEFDASNRDIRSGVFGFDKIPSNYKNICKSDISALKNEYTPIKVEDEEYLVSWVSIRKGQTITLKLDKDIDKKNEYKSIAFEQHPDFTITPTDLKDAKEILITCKNTNQNTAQIKVMADGETAGALNFFYPKPKNIDLKWCFVEITGGRKNNDKEDLEGLIDKTKLETLLKKGLNPALIDVTLKNATASIGNLTKHKEFFTKSGIIKKTNEYHYIESKKKNIFAAILQKELKPDTNLISLYLVNRNCLTTGAMGEGGGTFDVVAGFSPTGTGVAYGILDEKSNLIKTAVMHEVMHALGLTHTFSSNALHQLKKQKTKNYMDYKGTKEFTWKWQWVKLHEYAHLK